jgi:hypothetical protein
LKQAIETGQTNRHIGCSCNKASSRSHAVLQIRVVNNSNNTVVSTNQIHRPHTAGASIPKQTSKNFRVLFIDLAGSERGIDAQNNEKENCKEGAEMNQISTNNLKPSGVLLEFENPTFKMLTLNNESSKPIRSTDTELRRTSLNSNNNKDSLFNSNS